MSGNLGSRLFACLPKITLNPQNSQFFYIDPIWLCLTSIQLIEMPLFFYIKELGVDLWNKNPENGHFSTKNGQKMALNGQNSQFFHIDPIWLIGMHLFFDFKELRVYLLNKNSKNGHFSTKNGSKMALNGQNSKFFYIDPIWLCLTSIQLIGTSLFFFIKELQVDLLKKNSKNGHFSTKNGP